MAAAQEPTPTVIVVGAGMSGIFAAKTLPDAAIKNILILEATNRVGGRIKKTNFAGSSVELGANWVEGVKGDQVNPIWTMVNKIGLKTYYSDFDHLANHTYKQIYGLVYEESVAQQAYDSADELSTFSQNLSVSLSRRKQTDMSILASQQLKNHDFGEDYYFVADSRGYESVVHYVANQFLTTDKAGDITDPRLVLNKAVTKIQYSKSGVVVKTEDGSVYKAKYVMVSASIGVLQTNLIDFVPDLPAWKLLAIYQFDMSIYTKIFLNFPYKFWPTGNHTEFFIHANEKRGYYTVWQQLENEYPGANCLLVTVTDDESRRVEQQPDSETLAEIMDVLRNMFGKNIPDATDILVPKWWSDRFYKGTFSNWPIGVDQHEYDQIRAPVGRVYFTGEHTSEHYTGYVHGAYLAGIDSANILIKCAKKKICKYNIKPKSS
ncbi:polyamine oxidase-like [Papaver somniferum]|uniref:polyamine oxidase-like n=1 Tax=Papaver somniferum TaxID=3469 RepID=UPI000E6FE856|nr:polyamine oxidase-like [Papaver somniferum]